jgi:hypothetical protein
MRRATDATGTRGLGTPHVEAASSPRLAENNRRAVRSRATPTEGHSLQNSVINPVERPGAICVSGSCQSYKGLAQLTH